MQRKIWTTIALLAIAGGASGLLFYLGWWPQTATTWTLLVLWIASSIGLMTFVLATQFTTFFTKEVEINFEDLRNGLTEDNGEEEDEDNTVTLYGTYLNPFMAQAVVRPLMSIWTATTLVSAVVVAIYATDTNVPLWATVVATILITVAFWWPNQPPFFGHTEEQAPAGQPTYPHMHIPDDFVGIVTWLGNRLPIYLTEGDQPWLPTWFGFGVNRAALYGAQTQKNTPVGENNGLVYVGVYVLPIWDSASKRDVISIENVTRGGSSVLATFLVSFVVTRPLIYAKTTDPILRIADQARAGLRKAFAYFRDIDVTSMKSVISSLTEGRSVRVAFTTRTIEHLPEGSVATNRVGDLFANLVTREHYEGDAELMAHAREKGHQRFFTDQDRQNGEPLFEATELSLREKLAPTIRATGGKIVGTVIGNITLSGTVSEAAQEAEAVGQRRLETLGLAQAQKDARQLLKPADGEEIDETARVIALLQSGVPGAKLVHTTGGGDSLSRAAATHASLSNGGNQ